MAKIVEIRGNIFDSSCQTIVNTVNCVGVMGKGIAFEYRHRFPEMFKSYAKLCENKQLHPGLLQLWTKSTPWILNFPTKNHWKYPSKIQYIESGLSKFAETYYARGITSIAFPELGTSSGGLKWAEVSNLMYKYLEPLNNLDIEIYHFDPNAKDTFFDTFFQKVHRFDLSDYKNYLNIPSQQSRIIKDAIESNKINTMLELQNLPGVGDKTFDKIYTFVNAEKVSQSNRLVTNSERQPSLNF